MVGDVGPARVVVIGLARDDDAAAGAQDAEGVVPAGGDDSPSVGQQQVQPGVRVALAQVTDELAGPLRAEVEQVGRQLGGITGRLGVRMGAEDRPVGDAVVRQQPPAAAKQ